MSPRALADMSTSHQLMFFTVVQPVARSLWALAKLGVADHLADGPLPIERLAELVDADPEALHRIVRATAAFGLFAVLPDGRVELTPAVDHLRAAHPASLRDAVLLHGDDLYSRPYAEIMRTVRGGRPAFDDVFGKPYHQHLDADIVAAQTVRRAEITGNLGNLDYLTSLIDLAPFATVADLGGGDGLFLAALLRRYPHLGGVLVDRPHIASVAGELLADAGLGERTNTRATDLRVEVPDGYDAYVLKHVLHEYPDETVLRILRTVRAAIGDLTYSRLFILERVVGAGKPDLAALVDIDMLLVTGGRERTAEQWRELITEAGFELVAAPARGVWVAHECRPA
jgi:multifunctional cyclase/dehydratase/O-methyltransferase